MTSSNNFTKYTQSSLHPHLCCDCNSQPVSSVRKDERCYYCGKIRDGLITPEVRRFNTSMRDQLKKLRSTEKA